MRSLAKHLPGTGGVDGLAVYLEPIANAFKNQALLAVDCAVGLPGNVKYECTVLTDRVGEPMNHGARRQVTAIFAWPFVQVALVVPFPDAGFGLPRIRLDAIGQSA